MDVLGTCYIVIRNSYSHNPDDVAHGLLEKEISRSFDGNPAQEKQETHQQRANAREKALKNAEEKVDEFAERVENGLRIRKQQYIDVNKNLAKGFCWDPEARESLIIYLEKENWTVVRSPTEADVQIAADCKEGDVVISGDSDLAIHPNVTMIWRPISGGRFLEYKMEDVMESLGAISRTQLTVLGIVSHNDYNKNIYGLGCATNFSIIKSFSDYLADSRVIVKNKDKLDFDASIRVFAFGQQTPVPRQESSLCTVTADKIKAKFNIAKERLAQRKKDEAEAKLSAKSAKTYDRVYRHKASQTFNRYRVVDRPPPQDKPIGNRNTPDVERQDQPAPSALPATYRPRYSMKSHKRTAHDPPGAMKQYKLKPWKNKSENPDDTATAPITDEPKAPRRGPRLPSIDRMTKAQLVKALAWEHPMVTLGIGTLAANVKNVLKVKDVSRDLVELAEDSAVAKETIDCVRTIVKEANQVKRKCQGLFGAYFERVDRDGATADDKEFLKEICPPIPREMTKDAASNTLPSQDSTILIDDDDTSDRQVQFIGCFMRYLYSNNYPRNTGIGIIVNSFIMRLEQMKLHKPVRARGSIDVKPEFSSSELVRSASTQLAVEMRKIYWHGTVELLKQLRTQFERDKKQIAPSIPADEDKKVNAQKGVDDPKGVDAVDKDTASNKDKNKDGNNRQSSGSTLSIHNNLSAVENFSKLNKLARNPRRNIPLSSREHGFLSFSEAELLIFFCGRPLLQNRIRSWADHTFSTKPSLYDLKDIWLNTLEPGFLIKMLLAEVGPKDLTSRQRGKAGYRGAIKLNTLEEIRDHLRPLREGSLDPGDYNSKGYALRGSIRTDGFHIQLLGFKIRELQRCRFKRAGSYPLPPRLTSTVGSLDYYLTEIRNIAETPADVARLWPHCPPDDIKVICFDLGQAFVAGVSVLLPDTAGSTPSTALFDPTLSTSSSALVSHTPSAISSASTTLTSSSASSPSTSSSQVFHNVAVSQKAVSQPTLRHRRWMEEAKAIAPEGGENSISDLESSLPPLRGEGASVIKYLEVLETVQDPLDDFYNGRNMLYKRHAWDAKRAKQEEFRKVADRLLNAIGGSVGAKRKDDNMVVIGIGLGQFKSNSGLTSLHESFLTFFVQLARSLGYIVVGVNEFYTSKKCPTCEQFVCQVNIRRPYCKNCKSYIHRDVMAGHNLCNVVKSHLTNQERPTYLQPVDENGNMPWKDNAGTNRSLIQEPSPVPNTVPSHPTKRSQPAPAAESCQGPSRPSKKSKATVDDRTL